MGGARTMKGTGGSTHIPGGHPQEGTKTGLLGWRLRPLGHDKDGLAVMATLAVVATEPDGTYEIPDR
jgi:hypothetical protein